MTQIDDIYGNAGQWVRQWTLVDGRAECVLDALPTGDPGAVAAMQRNAAVRELVVAVEAYEAALSVGEPNNGEPRWIDGPEVDGAPTRSENPAWALSPREITATDADGNPVTVTDPSWVARDDAVALIAATTEPVRALAHWRAGEFAPEGAPTWQSIAMGELDRLAALPLAHDPRPVPAKVQMWQAQAILERQGLLQQATTVIEASSNGALVAFWRTGTEIHRSSPSLAGLAAALGLSGAQVDDLFRAADRLVL